MRADRQVEESLGMAMSFTLVASCREALSGVVSTRLIREQEAEDRKAKEYEEVSYVQWIRSAGRRVPEFEWRADGGEQAFTD